MTHTDRGGALVTGAAVRLGRAMARRLASRGFGVVVHYRRSDAEARALVAEIERDGGRAVAISADLAVEREAVALVREASKAFELTVLVNNASVFERDTFPNSDTSGLRRALEVNFVAPYVLTSEFAAVTSGPACVVNLLDGAIAAAHTEHFDYLLSRQLLARFTRLAAARLAPRIRVNGFTDMSPEQCAALDEMVRGRLPYPIAQSLDNVLRTGDPTARLSIVFEDLVSTLLLLSDLEFLVRFPLEAPRCRGSSI